MRIWNRSGDWEPRPRPLSTLPDDDDPDQEGDQTGEQEIVVGACNCVVPAFELAAGALPQRVVGGPVQESDRAGEREFIDAANGVVSCQRFFLQWNNSWGWEPRPRPFPPLPDDDDPDQEGDQTGEQEIVVEASR